MAENGSSTTGLEKATAALRELGQAWRGDWNDFDGRTLRDQLDDWIERVLVADDVDEAIADWRRGCGLCPRGHGHWSYYCADFDPKEPADA